MAESNKVPLTSEISQYGGLISTPWEKFFRKIQDIVDYLKDEGTFSLVNNQSSPADITPLVFDYRYTSQAVVEYVLQRCTSSVEAVEAGRITAIYLPETGSWNVAKVADVTTGTPGFTVTITSAGQLQYTTTNQAGTFSFSRITYRVREIKAKSSSYSLLG